MNTSALWKQKDATLSDKTAEKEYGLTRSEIIDAINDGELQFREGSMHGNPWFRLLRIEVEKLVESKHGAEYLREKLVKKELSEINSELKSLNKRKDELETRKRELMA